MNGLELIKHTVGGGEMTASGTPNGAVSLVKQGKIEFTNATEVIVDDCFSTNYDNYLIVSTHKLSASDATLNVRVRSAGTNQTGNNYVYQRLFAGSTTVGGPRTSFWVNGVVNTTSATTNGGEHIYIYGPHLAQPTAWRSVTACGFSSSSIDDYANTHSLSSSYDGLTLFPNSGNITGTLTIYGYTKGLTP